MPCLCVLSLCATFNPPPYTLPFRPTFKNLCALPSSAAFLPCLHALPMNCIYHILYLGTEPQQAVVINYMTLEVTHTYTILQRNYFSTGPSHWLRHYQCDCMTCASAVALCIIAMIGTNDQSCWLAEACEILLLLLYRDHSSQRPHS